MTNPQASDLDELTYCPSCVGRVRGETEQVAEGLGVDHVNVMTCPDCQLVLAVDIGGFDQPVIDRSGLQCHTTGPNPEG